MSTEQPKKKRTRISCMDCGKKRPDLEYYMLLNPIWDRITTPEDREGFLCLNCVESRLGRKLKPRDFRFTPSEMRVRLFLSRTGHEWWGAVLEERRTKHRLFNKLAAGATSPEDVEQRIIAMGHEIYQRRFPACPTKNDG